MEGVVVYTKELNGCLNGVYANDARPLANTVYNEIAKLIDGIEGVNDEFVGNYHCSWIERDGNNDVITNGRLEIRLHTDGFYELNWFRQLNNRNVNVFRGKGFQTGPFQLAVRYEDAP